MKKIIIFESILILFFVLAWNVSKADEKSDYCNIIDKQIEKRISSVIMLDEIFADKDSNKKEIMKYMDEDNQKIYMLSTIKENICD